MFFVQIAAFAIIVILIAYKEKETITDIVPLVACLLTLGLYGLAFVGGLYWSDYGAVLICLLAVCCVIKLWKQKRLEILLQFLKDELKKPGVIAGLVLLIIIPVMTSGKVITWWDDYNFWATDAKALYYLNGFATKYQNVAPEFGDYPPGTQMMKWWFLHMSPDEFKEGLIFSGYYFMNMCFLLPLLRFFKNKNPLCIVLTTVVLWMFPTCTEVFGTEGCCADLTMALIYGAFLVAVVDKEDHSSHFYYGRQVLYLMVMVLCKNTGFIWVAFGLLFSYGYEFFRCREAHIKVRAKNLIVVTMCPIFTEISWLLFCLINRRVAKLTGTAVQMATGNMNIPGVNKEMVNAFVTAFVKYPLHRFETFAIDLSPLTLYLLLILFVVVLYKSRKLQKWQCVYISIFVAVSGAVFYSINLLGHLTIFVVETQYLEPFGMVSSIERYGAPFTIGSLYLLAYFSMRNGKLIYGMNKGVLICMTFVLLTANYECAYRGIWGYQEAKEKGLAERAEIVDEQAEEFLLKVGAGKSDAGKRVLYLRDASDYSWVRNTYVGFEAAPVSVMYGNIDGSCMESADVVRAISDAHAGYLYVDEINGGRDIFTQLTEGVPFEYSSLYQINVQNGTIRLLKADE